MTTRTPKTEPKANIELILYRLDEIKGAVEEMKVNNMPRPEITEKFKAVHERINEVELTSVKTNDHASLHDRVKAIEGVFSIITKVTITAVVLSLLAILGLKTS